MNPLMMALLVHPSFSLFTIQGGTYTADIDDGCEINLLRNGTATAGGTTTPDPVKWWTDGNDGSDPGDDYDFRFVRTGGTEADFDGSGPSKTNGRVDTWQGPIDSSAVSPLEYSLGHSTGVTTVIGYIEIRPTGGGSTLYTSPSITIQAEAS